MGRRRTTLVAIALAFAAALAVRAASRSSPTRQRPAPAVARVPALPPPSPLERAAASARAEVRAVASRPDALPALIRRFETTTNAAAQEEVLLAAARLGTPESAEWLARVAESDRKFGARASAALGSVSSTAAADRLAAIASGTAPTIVRANAARALGGAREHADGLVALVTDPSQPLRVRQEAALALGQQRASAAAVALGLALDEAAPEASGAAQQLRVSIIQALRAIGTADADEALDRHRRRAPAALEMAFLSGDAAARRH